MNITASRQKSKNFAWSAHAPIIILTCLIVGYIGAMMVLHVVNFNRFRYGFDLSFYEQSVWNTVHGRFLQVSATDFSSSLLGTDAILILALIAPFYAVVPSPFTMLFLETLVVGLGALPIFWLARERLKNPWAGLLLAAAYLWLLPVQNANLYEWRERPMAMGFWLWAFYFYQRGRFKTFGVFALLVLCCRPENGLVLAMLALYGFWQGYHRKWGWRFVLGPLVLGLVWFGVVVTLVIPLSSTGHSFALAENYGGLGQSPGDILKNLVTQPFHSLQIVFPSASVTFDKLIYIPLLLLPFAFLPLGSPSLLLMTLPPLLLNILSVRETQTNPYDYHYQGSVIPWLVFATIFTIEKLANFVLTKTKNRRGRFKLSQLTVGLSGLVLAFTLIVYLLGLYLTPANNPFKVAGNNPFKKTFASSLRSDLALGEALLKEIPPDAPLAISNLWADHVPMRPGLWLLGIRNLYSTHPTLNAQYVFVDQKQSTTPDDAALINTLLHSPDWQTIDAQGAYILLKRQTIP